jgi:hypothetical protein
MKGEAAKTHGLTLDISFNQAKTNGKQRINIAIANWQLFRFQRPYER